MIAFKHQNPDGDFTRATLVFEVPRKVTLLNMAQHIQDSLVINTGVTYVHPKDNFNKTRGREQALLNLHVEVFYLKSVELRDGRLVFHFFGSVPNRRPGEESRKLVNMGFAVANESENVRLEYAFLE